MGINNIEQEMQVHSMLEETLKEDIKERWNNNNHLEEIKKSIIADFVGSHEIDDWSIEYIEDKILIHEEDETLKFTSLDDVIEYYSEDIKSDVEVGILNNDGYYDFYLNKEQLYYLGLDEEYEQQIQYLVEGTPVYEDLDEPQEQTEEQTNEIISDTREHIKEEKEKGSSYDLKQLANVIDQQLNISDIARESGFDLVKNGRGSFKTTEHSSLVLDMKKNRFYWNSQNINGGVVKFWMQFQNKSFKEAVLELKDRVNLQDPEKYKMNVQEKEEISAYDRHKSLLKQLHDNQISNDKNKGMKNVRAYLIQTRGIEPDVVQKMIQDKVLYQISDEEGRTQVAFVGHNENGYICSVCKRSTSPDSKFKGDFSGCDYNRGWFYDPTCKLEDVIYNHQKPNKDKTLLVFESNIDMMSYMSLLKLTGKDYNRYAYLSCGSISKSQSVLETCKLYGYQKAFIMFDNDMDKGDKNPGLNRAIELSEKLNEEGVQAKPLVPSKCNDWNDTLIAYKKKEITLNHYKDEKKENSVEKENSIFSKIKELKNEPIVKQDSKEIHERVHSEERGL